MLRHEKTLEKCSSTSLRMVCRSRIGRFDETIKTYCGKAFLPSEPRRGKSYSTPEFFKEPLEAHANIQLSKPIARAS
ncbi:MAG: hypothetical protein QXP45_01105 [Thermoproteota archaeon]